MQTETEISAKIRFWEGVLEGLRVGSDRAASDKKKYEAEAKLETLRWALTEAEKADSK